MTPSILKERLKTSAQRPDIVIACQNLRRADEAAQPSPPVREEER